MKNILFYLLSFIFSLFLFTSCDIKDLKTVSENDKTTLLINPQEITSISIKNLTYSHNGCRYRMVIRFREYGKVSAKYNITVHSLFYVKEEDILFNYDKIKQSMKNKDEYIELFYNYNGW